MSWLSYLTPLSLYRGTTARGTLIEVRELYGQRKLDLNGYPQTNPMYRHRWNTILRRSKVASLPGRGSALILGLGGGDVARVFSQVQPAWRLTFVELEPEVIAVAAKYFGIGKTRQRSIVQSDARAYIARSTKQYDLVIVDLYSGDDVPAFVTKPAFLRGIARSLKPKGRAIFNYASHHFDDTDFQLFEKQLHRVFTRVTPMKTWGHTFYLTS